MGLAKILLAKLQGEALNRVFSPEEVALIYSPDLLRKEDPLAKIIDSYQCLQFLLKGDDLAQNPPSSVAETSAGVVVRRRLKQK